MALQHSTSKSLTRMCATRPLHHPQRRLQAAQAAPQSSQQAAGAVATAPSTAPAASQAAVPGVEQLAVHLAALADVTRLLNARQVVMCWLPCKQAMGKPALCICWGVHPGVPKHQQVCHPGAACGGARWRGAPAGRCPSYCPAGQRSAQVGSRMARLYIVAPGAACVAHCAAQQPVV